MKKIAVITIHRNCNYGSVLQTLATQKIFNSLGFECEIIDFIRVQDTKFGLLKRLKYKSKRLENNPLLLLAARICMYISYVKKEMVFDAFLKKYINLSNHNYKSNSELIGNPPQADAYCTGSDQIWNSHWNEGVEPAFYLDFVENDAICFSYSSSIGQKNISKNEADQIKPMLEKYRYLSVRENTSVNTLNHLGFDEIVCVLDPTLYINASFWNKIASDKFKGQKYIVTYNLHHDKKLDQFAYILAKRKKLKIINISYNWHDIIRKGSLSWCPKVEEYLGLIRDAEYVIADSFHATVFSLQFRKKFIIFYPEQASIRMRDLLKLAGLEDRGTEIIPKIEDIDRNIDYTSVQKVLNSMRIKDTEFLKKVAAEINNK